MGAVSLAVKRINENDTILNNTKLSFKFGALDKSNRLDSLLKMTEFRDQGVAAFIGPDEDCDHEARLASAWNLPMIAYVSLLDIQEFCLEF